MPPEFAMRKIAGLVLALALACAAGVNAQTISAVRPGSLIGPWQGTLQVGANALRVIFVLSDGDGGAMRAVMYSIDQTAQPIAASAPVVQGSSVRIAIPALQGTYEATLDASGTTMTGTFTQAGRPTPLVLTHATTETAWTIPTPVRIAPMAADAPLAFEVATIRPSKPEAVGPNYLVQGHRIATMKTSLNDLISFAYGVHTKQVAGGQDWMDTEKYDLLAEPEAPGAPNDKQLRGMIQKLLAERFGLVFHREKRELAVYALLPTRTGAKLTKSAGDPNGLPGIGFGALGALRAVNATMTDLAGVMQSVVLDRPVVDQAGVEGRYDFSLTWTPDDSQFRGLGGRIPPPSDAATAPPGLFTAIQEQLGLRLDSTRAPVDVLVIDRANHPTPD
jgi:uncharacterized protein (TIGR03435 family)